MAHFPCPYLDSDVELTNEREFHIILRHPELFPEYRRYLANTLAHPDQVRRSARHGNARLFSRWFEKLRSGKYVIVVVMSDLTPSDRHWIITAYVTGKLTRKGDIEWQRT